MIQLLLPLLISGLGGAVEGLLFYDLMNPPVRQTRKTSPDLCGGPVVSGAKTDQMDIFKETILEENSVVLAREDVPLDNRFGLERVVSDHIFTQTAQTSVSFARNRSLEGSVQGKLFTLAETRIRADLSRELGCRIGQEITREIRLRLTAPPQVFAHYHVLWKQDTRRGIYDVVMGRKRIQIPYLVTYGLSHSVESIQEEVSAEKLSSAGV
ncbi:MAG: hypothetical protein HQL63_13690 [Magnetococcales bacterium]|nr:hypothetical protein [Magnetococcales bacterium]MBF0322787.1 hypothetical protein [Magnetococcales bacterium]